MRSFSAHRSTRPSRSRAGEPTTWPGRARPSSSRRGRVRIDQIAVARLRLAAAVAGNRLRRWDIHPLDRARHRRVAGLLRACRGLGADPHRSVHDRTGGEPSDSRGRRQSSGTFGRPCWPCSTCLGSSWALGRSRPSPRAAGSSGRTCRGISPIAGEIALVDDRREADRPGRGRASKEAGCSRGKCLSDRRRAFAPQHQARRTRCVSDLKVDRPGDANAAPAGEFCRNCWSLTRAAFQFRIDVRGVMCPLSSHRGTGKETRSIPPLIDTNRLERSGRQERAILVGVILPGRDLPPDDPLDELRGLAKTAGLNVVASLIQKRQLIDIATYIGSGKVEELKTLVDANEADVVVFDNDLGPAQMRNLEKQLEVKVVDRTEVILDIFATHARTHEAHLQVELAQLEYAMPRLKRMWTHLSRYKGGIGFRGPGEKQLEEDRRLVAHRIQELKAKLRKIQARKEREVASRSDVPTVSLVGYTNAGKSTLMNALTEAGVLVEDKLFATLDTRTRRWRFRGGQLRAAFRHGRLHPRPAARSGRLVQGNARGSPAGRLAVARRRCLQPRGRGPDPGGQGRPRRARAGEPAHAACAQQVGQGSGPLVSRRAQGTPHRIGRHQRGQGRGARPARRRPSGKP